MKMTNDDLAGRRNFIKGLGAAAATIFFAGNLRADDSSSAQKITVAGQLVRPDDDEQWLIGPQQCPVRIKAGLHTGSTKLAMGTQDLAPGARIPVHKHGREDELIFIQAGEATLTLGDDRMVVKKGTTAFVPLGAWHGLENTGTELVVMIWTFSPAGFEQYFRDIGIKPGDKPLSLTNEEWHKVDAKNAITYKM